MNEGAKTGIYWAAAVAMLAVAITVSWPPTTDNDTESLIGQPLFSSFTDPLAAASLRIVSFEDGRGEVGRFEVAKDDATGVWSIPSRNNYPADALEQMQKAANALIDLKVLDIQTENAEDHAELGVVEPKADAAEFGAEGVGRLVTFRGEKNSPLGSLIVGNPVSDSDSKRYVRIPGQDPVYVVNLDNAVFSTKFEDWIEKDLLQLSSIDISEIAIESYDAALDGRGGSVSLERAFDAELAVVGGSDWELRSLVRYDDQQQPQPSQLAEGESLATTKLNELKNALDDLKIVDVAAKPKGMSENLKADKDLVSDNEAVRSLAVRGFFPLSSGDIISANGQMDVTLNDGVQYVLRFGNIQGLSETGDDADADDPDGEEIGGANRYLLVTAQVDEAKFPAPDLKPIPKTIEELDAMNAAAAEPAADAMPPAETPAAEAPSEESPAEPSPAEPMPADPAPAAEDPNADKPAAEKPADEKPADEKPADEKPAEAAAESPEEAPQPAEPAEPTEETSDTSDEKAAAETTDEEGAAETTDETDENSCDVPEPGDAGDDAAEAEAPSVAAEPAADEASSSDTPATEPAVAEDEASATETPAADAPATEPVVEETAEEKQERLEAEQEKITKENQRMLDERKNRLEAARVRVRELNGRFADWYYVIPESTYRKLRLSLDDLIETADSESGADVGGESSQAPTFNFPGLAP